MKKIILGLMILLLSTMTLGALGDNYKIVFSSGTVTINTSRISGTNIDCSDVTGASYDVCLGSGGTGSVDYSKVQNYSDSPCPTGQYVYSRLQNGTFLCRADVSGGDINNTDVNVSKLIINDFVLPTSDGSANYVLKTDGNGIVSWQPDAAGSGGGEGVFAVYGSWIKPNTTVTGGIDDLMIDVLQANDWSNFTGTADQITNFNETVNTLIDIKVTLSFIDALISGTYATINYVDSVINGNFTFLDNKIDTEITDRQNNDTYLQNQITTEITDRQNNDTELQNNIDLKLDITDQRYNESALINNTESLAFSGTTTKTLTLTLQKGSISNTFTDIDTVIDNCSIDQSCANIIYTSDKIGNTTSEIWNVVDNGTFLNIDDQRYNETDWVLSQNYLTSYTETDPIYTAINDSIVFEYNTTWKVDSLGELQSTVSNDYHNLGGVDNNCSIDGSCDNVCYLDYDNQGDLNISGNLNVGQNITFYGGAVKFWCNATHCVEEG